MTFSADEPERLRGPQHDAAWCDELAAWRYPQAFDMLLLGLRLGSNPRLLVTTTPRPTALIKQILAAPTTVRTGGSTYENKTQLAPEFISQIAAKFEGTRLGRQELHAELLEVSDGVWFVNFNPSRHVTTEAEISAGLPVRIAIDAGTSRHTGAVFFQVRELGPYRHRVTVFGEYYATDLFSEQNALEIKAKAMELCRGRIDCVRLDPAASARTGVGPAAFGEYQRVFGTRITNFWPVHPVLDGLDQLELLLGSDAREPDLLVHPRCGQLIEAFNSYVRAQRSGEWLSWPLDPQHPHEEMIDSLRGGIRDALPEGRAPRPEFLRVPARSVF
jgi:hypothetical protein